MPHQKHSSRSSLHKSPTHYRLLYIGICIIIATIVLSYWIISEKQRTEPGNRLTSKSVQTATTKLPVVMYYFPGGVGDVGIQNAGDKMINIFIQIQNILHNNGYNGTGAGGDILTTNIMRSYVAPATAQGQMYNDILNEFSAGTRRQEVINWINADATNKKVLLVGYSAGGTFSSAVYKYGNFKNNPNVYLIGIGTPAENDALLTDVCSPTNSNPPYCFRDKKAYAWEHPSDPVGSTTGGWTAAFTLPRQIAWVAGCWVGGFASQMHNCPNPFPADVANMDIHFWYDWENPLYVTGMKDGITKFLNTNFPPDSSGSACNGDFNSELAPCWAERKQQVTITSTNGVGGANDRNVLLYNRSAVTTSNPGTIAYTTPIVGPGVLTFYAKAYNNPNISNYVSRLSVSCFNEAYPFPKNGYSVCYSGIAPQDWTKITVQFNSTIKGFTIDTGDVRQGHGVYIDSVEIQDSSSGTVSTSLANSKLNNPPGDEWTVRETTTGPKATWSAQGGVNNSGYYSLIPFSTNSPERDNVYYNNPLPVRTSPGTLSFYIKQQQPTNPNNTTYFLSVRMSADNTRANSTTPCQFTISPTSYANWTQVSCPITSANLRYFWLDANYAVGSAGGRILVDEFLYFPPISSTNRQLPYPSPIPTKPTTYSIFLPYIAK